MILCSLKNIFVLQFLSILCINIHINMRFMCICLSAYDFNLFIQCFEWIFQSHSHRDGSHYFFFFWNKDQIIRIRCKFPKHFNPKKKNPLNLARLKVNLKHAKISVWPNHIAEHSCMAINQSSDLKLLKVLECYKYTCIFVAYPELNSLFLYFNEMKLKWEFQQTRKWLAF